jgi:hypothetical protein
VWPAAPIWRPTARWAGQHLRRRVTAAVVEQLRLLRRADQMTGQCPRFQPTSRVEIAKMGDGLLNDPTPDPHTAHQAPVAVNLTVLSANRGAQIHAPSQPPKPLKKMPLVGTTRPIPPSRPANILIGLDPPRRKNQEAPSNCASWAMVCRHSFEGKEGGNEVDRSGEAGVGLVVSSGDPAELSLSRWKKFFGQVTPFVHLGVARDRRFAVRLRRNDGQGASFIESGAQGVLVERLVGDESIKTDARYKRLDPDAIVPLARQQDEARQIAQRIDERDDLGRQPAARPADGLILSPPFAPAPCR